MRLKILSNKIIIPVLFLFVLLTYGNIFNNKLLWDDEAFIIGNPDIRAVSNIPKFFANPDFSGLYRPLKSVLMTATYKIWGLNPFGYHLNSFLLHLISTYLVFFISLSLFKGKCPAFLTSILFAVHPIHTERVTGATAGFDLLGVVFYLLSIFLYIKFREKEKKRYFYYSLLSFVLALLSSEEAISLPLVLLLYEVIFNHKSTRESLNKDEIRKTFKKTSLYFSVLILYLILRFFVLGKIARGRGYIAGSFYSSMLTMPKVIIKYIGLLIFPIHLSLSDRMPFSTSILDLRVILSLIALLAVLFYAFRQSSNNRLASFAVFWFFITLLPFYNIIPITSLYAERYLYIPSFSVCILYSLLAYRLKNIRKWLAILFILILVVFFSVRTFVRNNDWQDAETLWQKTIETSNGYYGGYNNLGMLYLENGKDEEALNLFNRAIDLNNGYAPAYNNLGKVYLDGGDLDRARELFLTALNLEPSYPDPYNNLGILYKKSGNYSLSISYYKKAISLKSSYYEAYYNLGTIYNEVGEYGLAIPEFTKAIEIRPTYAKAHNNLGVSLINAGRTDEAIAEFKRALSISPGYKEAQNNLDFAYDIKKTLKSSADTVG